MCCIEIKEENQGFQDIFFAQKSRKKNQRFPDIYVA